MNFQQIQEEAELRVHKGTWGFDIEYKNPGDTQWKFYAGSVNHIKAEETANEISQAIHKEPKTYKTEGHYPRRRTMPEELKDWE